MLDAGLRPGEAFALQWRHVDFERGVVLVRGTLARVRAEERKHGALGWKITRPKTKASIGDVPLRADTLKELRHWKARQAEQRLLVGAEWQDHGFVFTTEFGSPLGNNMGRAWERVLRQADGGRGDLGEWRPESTKPRSGPTPERPFTPHFSMYVLRHTCATLLLLGGMDLPSQPPVAPQEHHDHRALLRAREGRAYDAGVRGVGPDARERGVITATHWLHTGNPPSSSTGFLLPFNRHTLTASSGPVASSFEALFGVFQISAMSVSGVLGPVLGALVVVAGWLVNHVLTLKAQRKNFRNQLVDRARMEIVRAIHAYQRWLSSFSVDLRLLHQPLLLTSINLPPNWHARMDRFNARLADRSATSDWSVALEEYESLFPETRQVRIQLLHRQREFFELLNEILGTLTTFIVAPAAWKTADQETRVKALQEKIRLLDDQAALLEDLRVHLQNVSLHEIAGTKVPERVPADPDVAKIVPGPDGQLTIRPYREKPLPPGVTTRDE